MQRQNCKRKSTHLYLFVCLFVFVNFWNFEFLIVPVYYLWHSSVRDSVLVENCLRRSEFAKPVLVFHSPSPIVNWIELSTWIVLRWYYCNHGRDLFLGPPKGPGHPSQPSRRSRLSPCDLFKLAFIPNWLVQYVECGKIPEILNMCSALRNTLHIQAMHVQYLTSTKIPDMCKTWYEQ